tara:strand:- start:7206 stop:7415 length:210 start_codon:yes stop_codon:yes gene_type:complete
MTVIARRSPMTGELNEMDLPVTSKQYKDWRGGMLIQNAMPNLTPEQREFIQTGLTPVDWKGMVEDANES